MSTTVTSVDLITACTKTQLGREAMLPTGLFTGAAYEVFERMLINGDIVFLEQSELSRHCPNKRFGLKDTKYPMTTDELFSYRSYCETNYSASEVETWPSYEEYLDLVSV